jgi:predicted transposase/invertase (TIGR01784 family)
MSKKKKVEEKVSIKEEKSITKTNPVNTSNITSNLFIEENLEKEDVSEVFTDPTYDVTFKMLFGTEENKDILISLLNSLLGFTGEKLITDVQFKPNQFKSVNVQEIRGAIDVLCITKNNQKIAIEMQKKFKDYFLARSQSYMSKLIEGQVENKESQKYHEVLMDTYILAIAEENIFARGKKDTLFERTVMPVIIETGEIVPDNKMCWKFFELPKFSASVKGKIIDSHSSLKVQWLDFFVRCNEKLKAMPEDIDELIKKGYEIMKVMNWSKEKLEIYKQQREDKLLEDMEQEKMKEKYEWKGEVKGEIKLVKSLLKYKIEPKEIPNNTKFLGKKKGFEKSMEDNLKDISYIEEHKDDSATVILGGLDIEYDSDMG